MVSRVVAIFAETHPHVERAELYALAQEALVQAAPLFEPSRNVSFAAFASRRVHGHLVRALHKEWLQRSTSGQALLRYEAPPFPEEDGAEAAPSANMESMRQWLMARGLANVLIALRHRQTTTPEDEAIRKQILQATAEALKTLPLDHHRVITLHYMEGVSLRRLAKDFKMSPSALGRLHQDALVRLRHELARRGFGSLPG